MLSTTSLNLKAQILQLLDQMPGNFAALPGEVFSTGMLSLARGAFYLVGLNPGCGSSYPTIRNHVANWSLDSYSAFLNQCWGKRCWNVDCYALQAGANCNCPRGTARHQKAVQKIIERAQPGADPRSVFATNAIFAKSDSADSFRQETRLSLTKAFDACWPIHQFFLSQVRPRVILSLGYAEDASAFSFFRGKANEVGSIYCHPAVPGRKFPSFKWADVKFRLGEEDVATLVVGIRHPSYVRDAADTQEFSDLVARYLGQQANLSFQPTAVGGG